MKMSKAEKAALAVAARAKETDEKAQPRLIDTGDAKTNKGKPDAKSKVEAKPAKSDVRSAKADAKAASKGDSKADKGGTKPKMRLVNGKLVPVDDPRFF
jgi:hypothetical protein